VRKSVSNISLALLAMCY